MIRTVYISLKKCHGLHSVRAICLAIPFFFFSYLSKSADYYIDNDQKWSALSPQPTSSDNIYVYNDAQLTVDVSTAECASIYIGYESGLNPGQGTLEFAKNSQLTVFSVNGVTIGSSSYDGELNMDKGGTLNIHSINVLNANSEFKAGKGTLVFTGNNILPDEFSVYNHIIISGGTTELSTNIVINGNITIAGTLDVSPLSREISINGNWINNGAFIRRNGKVIFAGSKNQVIGGSNSTDFYSLEMNKKKGVSLSAGAYVYNQLELTEGNLYTDHVNYLTIEPSAVISGGSDASYIDGRIKIETDTIKTIVIGTGKNGKYKKAALSTQSADPSVFFVEYFHTPPPNSNSVSAGITHICKTQYWDIIRISGSAPALLTLYWNINCCGPMDLLLALKVARYDSTQWVSGGSSTVFGDPLTGFITSDTLNSFGCFTFGCNHGGLKTSGNIDNFSEENVEIPEENTISQVEIEQNTKVPVYNLEIMPNPVIGKMNVILKGNKGNEVLIVVVDLLGRTHYSKIILLKNDEYKFAIDPSEKLNPGVYMVVGSSNDILYKKKIVIK